MWNLLKRFVLTVMRLKMATKLFKKTKTFRALKDKLEQPIVQVFTFLRDNENVSESTRNSCRSSFWIMRAKKGDLNGNTEPLFKLTDGHCVCVVCNCEKPTIKELLHNISLINI